MSIQFEPDAPERKERCQNNFDRSAFGKEQGYIKAAVPEPFQSNTLDYRENEITVVSGVPQDATQVLIGETSHFRDVTSAIAEITRKVNDLKSDYNWKIRAEFARLVKANQIEKTWWKKTTILVYRKAVYRKVKAGTRTFQRLITLGTVQRYRTFRRRDSRGRIVSVNVLVEVPRKRRVTIVVPKYNKVYVRKAGLRKVTSRVPETVQVTNWKVVRPAYLVFKGQQRDKLDATLAPLLRRKAELERMLMKRRQQPKRLETYTSHGFVPENPPIDASDSLREVTVPTWVQDPVSRNGESITFSGLGSSMTYRLYTPVAGRVAFDETIELIHSVRPSQVPIRPMLEEDPPGYPLYSDRHVVESYMDFLSVPHRVTEQRTTPVKEQFELGSILLKQKPTFIGSVERERDVQIEHLAALQVENLSGMRDKSFDLTRSTIELKDLSKTAGEIYQFLYFLYFFFQGHGFSIFPLEVQSVAYGIYEATRSVLLGFIAGYLAWRFAIQPTIQDCQTVKENLLSDLIDVNRTLSQMIRQFEEARTNILHVRVKRHLAGNRQWEYYVHVDDQENDPVVNVDVHVTQNISLLKAERTVSSEHVTVSSELHSITPMRAGDTLPPIRGVTAAPFMAQGQTFDPDGNPARPVQGHLVLPEGSTKVDATITLHPDEKGPAVVSSRFADNLFVDKLRIDDEFQDVATASIKGVGTPSIEMPWYAENRLTVVYFARYIYQGVLLYREFLDEEAGLPKLVNSLKALSDFMKRYDSEVIFGDRITPTQKAQVPQLDKIAAEFLADFTFGLDPWVAWEVSPLSFVYDWFTTSQTLARICSEWKKWREMPGPPSMEGVWASKRTELMVGRPSLALTRCDCTFWVTDWYSWHVETGERWARGVGPCDRVSLRWPKWHSYGCCPRKSRLHYELRFRKDREVLMKRSGLYRAVRGEFLEEGWKTFLPRIEYKVDTGKSLTLIALVLQLCLGKAPKPEE